MKKSLCLLLVLALTVAMFAGCTKSGDNETTGAATQPETTAPAATAPVVSVKDSLEVMTAIWNGYVAHVAEDYQFPVAGGFPKEGEEPVFDMPAALDLAAADTLVSMLHIPAELIAQVTDGASVMHMMNANTFTAATYHVADGTDVSAFINTLSEAIKGTQWVCGFPEQLVVATVAGQYVVAAYGNSEIINLFKAEITAAYPDAEIVVADSLA